MNYRSRITFESQIIPDVRVVLRRFSPERRVAIELATAEWRQKFTDTSLRYAENVIDPGEIDKDGKIIRAGDSEEVCRRKAQRQLQSADEAEHLANAHLKVPYLRAYVERVEGLDIEGAPATVEMLIAEGPVELADEIYNFIQDHAGLSADERKNSPSPSTSPTAEGATSSTSSARGAVGPVTTSTATAAEIIQNV